MDLATPFVPKASLVKPAGGLDMVEGRNHSLEDLLSEQDCSSHR